MDFIKAQVARLQQQLSGLTPSQKMLTASLLAIMLLTLWFWARYAGTPEMAPVLDQAFSSEDMSRITTRIAAKGIAYRVEADKVLVPTDRKIEVLADLGYAQLLPQDTRTGFDEIVKQMSPWDPVNKQQVMWNRAKEMTLAKVIRNFPAVANAVVIIDPTDERRLSGNSTRPSATVYISMRNGDKPDKRLINAAADVVAGAVSAINRGRIAVIVDGTSYSVRDKNDPGSLAGDSDIIDLIQANERHYSNKVSEQLAFIKGVMVSVTVELNTKNTHTVKHSYDPNVIQKESDTETETEETNQAAGPGGEPGTGANVSASIATAAPTSTGSTTSSEKTRTRFQNFAGSIDETSTSPAGTATVVAASVRVPLSYFAEVFRRKNPSAKEPDEAMLQKLVDVELPKIRDDVKACTGLKSDDMVKVETYADAMPSVTTQPQVIATSMPMMLGDHAKEIAVGALAVVSLLMVSLMVRKSSPLPALAATEHHAPQRLASGEDLAGEAAEGNPLLDGVELDEDAVRTQQMLNQVSTLVDENPDAAANLVKRWLNRS